MINWVTACLGLLFLLPSLSFAGTIDQDSLSSQLRSASCQGHLADVIRLVRDGAQVDGVSLQGRSALMCAAIHGHAKVVQYLLEQKANVNLQDHKDNTALVLAAWNCNNKTVEVLLSYDANVNLRNHNRQTALMNAAEQGCARTVELLLQVPGIDVNATNDWYKSALDYALQDSVVELEGDFTRIVKMLKAHGAREWPPRKSSQKGIQLTPPLLK